MRSFSRKRAAGDNALLAQAQCVDGLHHFAWTSEVVHAADVHGVLQVKGFARVELLAAVAHHVKLACAFEFLGNGVGPSALEVL